jgi:lipoprotein-releasing system permease protein
LLHLLRARLKQTIVAAVGVTFSIAMFIALVSFMNGLNEMLDGLMLNRTPHILLYNVKPSENQPLGLSEDYKKCEFHSVHKTKDRGNQYTTVCRLLRP